MKFYNYAILIVCIVVVAISMTCQTDDLGISIFGFKWHLHCMSKHLVGINCALCGMTHSFCAIGHGQLAKGFEYHRLGPVLFCFILFQIPYRMSLVALKVRRRSFIKKANVYFAIVTLAALIVNWLVYLGEKIT
jgi:hypothetical protein